MDRPRMRPVFREPLPCDADDLLAKVREYLSYGHGHCRGRVFKRHVVLNIAEEDAHFWSPRLHVELRVRAEDDHWEEDHVHGRFLPHPHVWTLFMAIYGVLAMLGSGAMVLGIAQINLGRAPWGLALAALALAIGLFTYGAAFIGQGLGAAQMYELRAFLDRAMGICAAEVPNAFDTRSGEG